MDTAIQSQIQSPLVRTLQSIPTNSANFVHGIPDNTPPFSKQTVNVEAYQGTGTNLSGVFRFKIPQRGHMNGLLLKYRMIGNKSNGIAVLRHLVDSPFTFGNGIEKIELRAKTDIIETIYATSLPFEALSMVKGEQMSKSTLQGLSGYRGADNGSVGILYPPRYQFPLIGNTLNPRSNTGDNAVQDFLIPVPLSSTFYLKDNFQTRLMEDLELHVHMRPSPIQVKANFNFDTSPLAQVNKHELSLSVDYINFHENVEEVIRNENFKPNIPAVLLQSDREHFRAKHESTTTGTFDTHTYSVDLNTDALVSDIFISGRVHPESSLYETYESLDRCGISFELRSGGETILSGSKAEFDGVASRNYSTVTRQYQNEGVLPLRYSNSGTHIRLGLNNTDEFFDGGISFQSLQNPKLVIVVKEADTVLTVDEGGAQTTVTLAAKPHLFEFDVVLKRKVMLRIDGNTGKISKSLES